MSGYNQFVAALQDHDLKLIAGLYTSWDDYEGGYEHKSIQQHLDAYRSQLETALSLGIPPTKLNVHSGDDLWSLDQCLSFYEQAIRIEKEFGVQGIVMHETHRGRPFHNIQTTSAVLKHFPDDLYLTADFSHLMVTHERLLGFPYHSQAAAARRARRSQGSDPPMSTGDEGLLHTDQLMLELCKRSRHIHARVGQENAPQVYDPMSAEFRHHLRLYER